MKALKEVEYPMTLSRTIPAVVMKAACFMDLRIPSAVSPTDLSMEKCSVQSMNYPNFRKEIPASPTELAPEGVEAQSPQAYIPAVPAVMPFSVCSSRNCSPCLFQIG